jgi:hypothetical protein
MLGDSPREEKSTTSVHPLKSTESRTRIYHVSRSPTLLLLAVAPIPRGTQQHAGASESRALPLWPARVDSALPPEPSLPPPARPHLPAAQGPAGEGRERLLTPWPWPGTARPRRSAGGGSGASSWRAARPEARPPPRRRTRGGGRGSPRRRCAGWGARRRPRRRRTRRGPPRLRPCGRRRTGTGGATGGGARARRGARSGEEVVGS